MANFATIFITFAALISISIFFILPIFWNSDFDSTLKTPSQPQHHADLTFSTSAEPTTTSTKTVYMTRTITQHRFATKTRSRTDPANASATLVSVKEEKRPIEVEMHIMSKCPDAQYCIHQLILPVMAELSDAGKMALVPHFIGTPTGPDGGASCKHGPSECIGNILEVCAYNMYKDQPKIWLPFIDCLSEQYEMIPQTELVQECAKEHAVDMGKLNDCASSEDDNGGPELLRKSMQHSIDVGTSISCTVRVAGKVRCVRDGDEWKDCPGGSSVEEFKRDIEKMFDEQPAVIVHEKLVYQPGERDDSDA